MSQELRVDITGNSKGLQKATSQADKRLQNFNNNLKSIAGNLAAAFGTKELLRFGRDASVLAGKVDGVRRAFEKLDGVSLDKLRESTSGTVSDLKLMQQTNAAAKLGLDVKQLGTLFAFASKQAQETGQSVDWLVESVVTGLGRKSVKILDNLSVSALDLKKALGGVSVEAASVAELTEALGKIAKERMGDAAGMVETTEVKSQRLNAAWENLTATFGTRSAPAYGKLLDFLTSAVDGIERLYLSTGQLSMRLGAGQGQDIISNIFGSTQDVNKRKQLLEDAIAQNKELRNQQGELVSSLEKGSGAWRDFTDSIGATTDQSEEAQKKVAEYTGIIEALESALASLNKKQEDSSTNTEAFDKILSSFNMKMAALNAEVSLFGRDKFDDKIAAVKAAMIALTVEGSDPAIAKIAELRTELNRLYAERPHGVAELKREDLKTGKHGIDVIGAGKTGAPAMPSIPVENPVKFNEELYQMVKGIRDFNEISQAVGFTWENLGVQFTQVFTGMLENGTLTFKGLMTALIKMITKMTVALITATALRSVMGDASAAPRALAAASAIATGVGALAAAGIPAMANGGVVTSPTLALIGEGRESEAVIPLSKLDAMMQGGGGGYVATARLYGQDTILQIDRARRFNGRING